MIEKWRRVYLESSYDEKEEIKSLKQGGPDDYDLYYDGDMKKWYTSNTQLSYLKYAKWIEKAPQNPRIDLENVNTSIKIGKDVSKQLLTDMQNAKERIYISSPYLGIAAAEYLRFLYDKKSLNNFKVLFSVREAGDSIDILKHFVGVTENEDKKSDYDKTLSDLMASVKGNKSSKSVLTVLLIIIFIIGYVYLADNHLLRGVLSIGYAVLALVILFIVRNFFNNRISKLYKDFFKKKKEFMEFIETIEHMNCKIVKETSDKESNLIFPHVKLYIIDDKAYLGSINFSNKALFFNIESVIEIKDKEKVDELAAYFEELYNFDFGSYVSIEELKDAFTDKDKYMKRFIK